MSRKPTRVRPERVAEQIRIEIAGILQRELEDPRIGLTTCTRVSVSRDLGFARIYVSVLGGEDEKTNTMEALEHASGYVRRLLSQRLGLRSSPEIRFAFDPSVEYSIKLDEMIEENKKRSPEDMDEWEEEEEKQNLE